MRIGIFGGSFDPVHMAHLSLAQCCLEQVPLDCVRFVPAAEQPLKPHGPRASVSDRLQMLHLAIAERPQFELSTIELDRGGVSYTADTLATMHAEQPTAELFFLMGADTLADLPRWRGPDELCRLATLVVVHRAGEQSPDFNVLGNLISTERLAVFRTHQVQMPASTISSTKIRQLIATDNDTWQSMVPAAVAQFINERGLYQASKQ